MSRGTSPGRPRKNRRHSSGRTTIGRPRVQMSPHIQWTPEIEKRVMGILNAAACKVLRGLGLANRGYVTPEDLIANAWLRTFFYLKDPAKIDTHLYVWAQIEMVRYIRETFGPWKYVSLDHATLDEDPTYDVPSERLADDPALLAEADDILRVLSAKQRKILFGRTIEGRTFREMGRRRRRTGERIRQLYEEARETLRDSHASVDSAQDRREEDIVHLYITEATDRNS